MDGGVVRNVNTLAAIAQCRELVDDDSKVTVDVLVCAGPGASQEIGKPPANTIGEWFRARGLSDAYSGPNIYR